MRTLETELLKAARDSLLAHYFPKIERCLELLPDEDLWWRAHETNNSVGNLLLHLAGSLRYWIVSGIGEASDHRQRQQEFDERRPLSRAELLALLRAALKEADATLASIGAAELLQPRRIGRAQRTPMQALIHAVEHFAYHTGQIAYIAKLRTGKDLGLS
ncbi:MAG: DUF1572 family protein [Acidobacteria bacterium]|nr:DUF1572 family protein [Acidobacteriota bacterium]